MAQGTKKLARNHKTARFVSIEMSPRSNRASFNIGTAGGEERRPSHENRNALVYFISCLDRDPDQWRPVLRPPHVNGRVRQREHHAHCTAFQRPRTLAPASGRSPRLGRADEHRTDQEDDAQDRGRV